MKLYLSEPYSWKVKDIDLRPTYRCQCKCPTCGSWKRKTADLSLAQTQQIIKHFKGLRKLIIEGGEPTLWPNLTYLIQNIDAEETTVITNAVDTERIKEICDSLNPAYFRWVVSLNGLGKTHDWSRGRKGAFYDLCNSCDYMFDKKYDIRFQFVCTEQNIKDLPLVKDFINKNYGREYINISYPSSSGIYGENIKATYLSNEDMRHTYMTDEFKFDRQGLLNKLIHDIFTEKVGKGELIPCLYGRSKIHINPEGKIQACQYDDRDEKVFGWVTDDGVTINKDLRKNICKNIIPGCQYHAGSLCSHEACEYSIRHNFFYLLGELWKRLI